MRLAKQHPLPVSALQQLQLRERADRQQAITLSLQSPSTASLAVALLRDTHNDDGNELTAMVLARLATYQRWQGRLNQVITYFHSLRNGRVKSHAIPMARSA